MIEVYSPVNGIITDADDDKITIYISPSDNHNVFSPIDGMVDKMIIENGLWQRNISLPYTDRYGKARIFQTNETKTGRLTISLINDKLYKPLYFWLEVGKPKYITDRIRMDVNEGDDVSSGEVIGEILIGSLSEIHFNGNQYNKLINPGDRVVGGKTVIAVIQ